MPSSIIRRLGGGITPRETTGLARPAIVGKPPSVFLHPGCPEFGAVSDEIMRVGSIASGAWFTANKPVAVQFTLPEVQTVSQLGWRNGSGTMTDSVDVGIYDTSWNRKISTGGTARSGAAAPQFVDVADTAIPAGRYWLAMSSNGVTAGNSGHWTGPANAVTWSMFGVQDSGTNAYVLPDPLTNMAASATTTFVPVMFIVFRALV